MPVARFTISAENGRAKRGRLETRRGSIETPAFMPVGTLATVKSLLPEEVEGLGAEIILGNTYHLLLRPGVDIVKKFNGLHGFMGWERPILTDSGGFQIFSLAANRKVDEEGATFRSHLDGRLMSLTPEVCIQTQEGLGSDIMMMLDECPAHDAHREYVENSLERDARWAARALNARSEKGGALFGIVQGGMHKDLRARSVERICGLGFDGHALGGLSVGEDKETMYEMLDSTVPLMPKDKAIYLMGVGAPEDLVTGAGLGVDMFDCVLPTRMARTGTLMVPEGRINLRNAKYARDERPPQEGCNCPTCRRFSRAYLRHLFISRELLAYRLASLHNLYYILGLMAEIRDAITRNEYDTFARGFFSRLEAGKKEAR